MRKTVIFLFGLLIYVSGTTCKDAARKRTSLDGRIVGGSNAATGEFPWIISLFDTSLGRHVCGGSIINDLWVVTAGHCVEFRNARILMVNAGEVDFSVEEGTEQSVGVRRVIIHPDYDTVYLENDIALLELASPLTFSSSVQPAILPQKFEAFYGVSVVAGWGDLEEGGTRPSILQKVTLPIVDDQTCNAAYSDLGGTFASNICAGYLDGGLDSCDGDSGGPMTCFDDLQHEILCGIVSWGQGCARPGRPGVYTEVSHFVDWIQTTIGF